MAEIIPAVLEKTYQDVALRLEQVAGLVETVQIDICDGVFVPSTTWPFISSVMQGKAVNYDGDFRAIMAGESEMPSWEAFDFELDLMIQDSARLLPDLIAMGPSKIFFHAEAFANLADEIFELKKMIPGIVEVGIAINADTDPSILFPLLDEKIATSVQCMGIAKIGFQGQPFDERVLANLKMLRARYPDMPLCVDGSVTLETAPRLVEAGATELASGSGIFAAPDISKRISEFKKILL